MSQLFKREVEKRLATLIGKLGFKKKKYFFYKPVSTNVTAVLGFGIASHLEKNQVLVNVTVGVSHKNIEELLSDLTGKITAGFMQPTIKVQIGYLMPNNSFKEWDFAEHKDNTDAFEDILATIQKYALPFQNRMKEFNNLFVAMKQQDYGILNSERDRYLPILYYLKGEKQEGLMVIQEALNRQKMARDKQAIGTIGVGHTLIVDVASTPESISRMYDQLKSGDSIAIIGAGIGKVDPQYLEFFINYNKL